MINKEWTKKLLEPVRGLESKLFTEKFVAQCIGHGADVNFMDESIRVSATQYAALCAKPSVLALVLDAGGDPDTPDWYGRPPLACLTASLISATRTQEDVLECIDLLAEHGANFNAVCSNSFEEPILHRFAQEFSPEIVRRIIEYGADPCGVDREGRTALSMCAYRADTIGVAIEILQARGLGPDDPIAGFAGKTAWDLCRGKVDHLAEVEDWAYRLKTEGVMREIEKSMDGVKPSSAKRGMSPL